MNTGVIVIYSIFCILFIILIITIYSFFETQRDINKWIMMSETSDKCGDDINCMRQVYNYYGESAAFNEIIKKCEEEYKCCKK